MDRHIQNLKFFIDGLGTRDVEFPETLTPQEITLIVELCITAAQTEKSQKENGFEEVIGRLWSRVCDELDRDEVAKLLGTLSETEGDKA